MAAQWCWGDELEIVAFCEKDPQCQKVIRNHFPWKEKRGEYPKEFYTQGSPIVTLIQALLNSLSGGWNVGSIDLISGGDPCPIRSKAASIHKTTKHPDLSGYFLAVVGICWPQWVVRENVPASDDVDFATALAILGYGTIIVSTNARSYTGQNRERDFIVGHREAAKLFDFASIISEGDQGDNTSSDQTKEYVSCLTTQSRRYDTRDGYVWDGRLRILDSKERTALSGFPEGWLNGFSETAVARMMGNCVVPQICYEIFHCIKIIEEAAR